MIEGKRESQRMKERERSEESENGDLLRRTISTEVVNHGRLVSFFGLSSAEKNGITGVSVRQDQAGMIVW